MENRLTNQLEQNMSFIIPGRCYTTVHVEIYRNESQSTEVIHFGLKNLHQKPIPGKVAKKQLKWYGHVRRMNETRKPKQYMEARPEGRRQRGRQRTTYADVIEHLGMKRGKTS